ncbi:beta-glucosidase-related glycosidase [Neocallimastix californiae]|uniref:beta-glucosidase n=1 Tax=Neocallimastix californiae TaxID=1754190 RepID=A0A1Y2FKJ7_9FUNG|nr:beta-glucosidase-related glycosidase [Neocallimastix californiae]|eukprot:ORY83315.1 beta-glucosidase-related glycosidase [Neocallimastix californiae]
MKIFNYILLVTLIIINVTFARKNNKYLNRRNNSKCNNINDSELANSGMTQFEINHMYILDKFTSECTVLLRKNGDFPIGNDIKKIHLYGNGARMTVKGGTGSGDVNCRSFDSIEQAFSKAGFEILTKDYLDAYDKVYEETKKAFAKKVQSETENPMSLMGIVMPEQDYEISYEKEGELAIYVLTRVSGEANDRNPIKGDLLLTDTEKKIILDLARGFKKFMLVLNTGGPVELTGLDEVKNILLLSQLGVTTSKTLVDIVTGKKYPSGKLATTWTKYEDYQTIGDFGNKDDTYYKEGIYVGYRYFDSVNADVMYPFGFGLGYTDFHFNVLSSKLVGDEFETNVSVKNVGSFNGKEVLELYLSKPGTTIDEPYQILVNFAKTKELGPFKKQNVKVGFKLSDFASYDEETATYFLDKGSYIVRVGNSSRNTKPCGVINVASRINVRKVENKMGDPGFKDFVPKTKREEEDLSRVKVFDLKDYGIKEEVVEYNSEYKVNDAIKALSNEEKIKLIIGSYEKGPEIITETTAGASGETAKIAGLKPLTMADGPAGLRIAKDYFVDEYGAHSLTGSTPESMIEFLPDETKQAYYARNPQPPEGAEILHQYTTAIPIGTAIAQSWNKQFAEICGDIVGSELEYFKINFWLAPALNIHRNILCGRNFEYYSEDPLIAGTFASHISIGVQKHKNVFVTLKHFAANNQENNRYSNNSHVSERALREIYLKGFEIAIKRANPKVIMTSYNLINGEHANENKKLISDILRNEFKFNGIVISDWLVGLGAGNKYPISNPYKVAKATNNVIMPGSVNDFNGILDALNKGEITIEEIEMSASRVYELAKSVEES